MADPMSPADAAAALRGVAEADHPYPSDRFAGRGIVMCAGGARMITCAWVAINVLRRVVGCELPIQLWHIGPRELGRYEAALFGELDVEVVDALDFTARWPARILGGWELKAYALVHSRFRQVLLMDADNVAVIDPSFLFELAQFADTGAIAWPDSFRFTRDSPIWEVCGVPFRDEPAWESGQLVVDKARCWRALQIALHMNMHSDVFYQYSYGDKDTFHMGWILAGASWAMTSHPARRTVTGVYQRDFDGRLIFQHRSAAKWRLGANNVDAPEFGHQAECLRFIEELRERWTGRIDELPPARPADTDAERAVAETRWFTLEERGGESRLLELLASNRVGIGSSRDRILRWYVRDGLMRIDGASTSLPPLAQRASGPPSFATSDGQPAIDLLPVPGMGMDALGLSAAAVIERFTEDPAISVEEAVTTIATLARVGETASEALDRARSRWRWSPERLDLIERAARRIGLGNPALDPKWRGYEDWE